MKKKHREFSLHIASITHHNGSLQ